ncbi:MAG: hypothetical protein JNL80_15570 [Phycisphaerae bacterium]|jgi:hypothetical protein|nr:hypothetical protein [Phycisphaerae bacterium]
MRSISTGTRAGLVALAVLGAAVAVGASAAVPSRPATPSESAELSTVTIQPVAASYSHFEVVQVRSADLDRDGQVGASDRDRLLGAWGTSSPAADLNGDGLVDDIDLALLLGAWNQ